ncbi:MAG: preprotein translocase subunit Tim44 [Phenylobacterium sp.]|uniref:Tim44 domain-containing protein n=1 Tax=Phenylobacterium sp. TaxID=1871053 RepID=UPI0026115FE0|nr:TIM44-like domain-containing protein [Phenylobacterium sp.]MDB5499694.1 preprotein translocase subunit Tim44 [Phenylobacterium sp.]
MTHLRSSVGAALGIALALGMLVAEPADARRGGSFGSRGARTYSQPQSTPTAPGYVPPVQRSMTAPGAAQPGGAYAPQPGMPGYAAPRPASRFGGLGGIGGGFLGGLLAGGLIGGLMGHGWGGGWGGGGGGLLTILIQLAVLFFVVSLAVRWFSRRRASASMPWEQPQPAFGGPAGFGGGGGGSGFGAGPAPASPYVPTSGPAWEIPITPQDQAAFETLLKEIQDAFGREDYGALRERTTPEVMSYLAEELSDNATHGRRNEVSDVRLQQADVGEAWSEGPVDYATAAMRYQSIDVMRDRTSGAVLSGDPAKPTETTELWTFARRTGEPWKLSAIQET